MGQFILALLPVLMILLYIYKKDKFEKEPYRLLIYVFLIGVASAVPIMFAEIVLSDRMAGLIGMSAAAYTAFVVAALTEEFFKFIILYFFLWKKKEFNEKYDAIVYAVFISMGFAALENTMYVFDHGIRTGLMRAITAVPAHALFAVSMGYYFGIARFDLNKRKLYFVLSLLVPVLLHGIYDFLLMANKQELIFVFIVFLIIMYRVGFHKIHKVSKKSRLNPFQK
jgi:RsiW-degrading membrane proteinase PrsW (M82 family)